MAKKKTVRVMDGADILTRPRPDRRLMPNVPDEGGRRASVDRRGAVMSDKRKKGRAYRSSLAEHQGIRYLVESDVSAVCRQGLFRRQRVLAHSVDISTTGMLLRVDDEISKLQFLAARKIKLKFRIPPGALPEGYESKVSMRAALVRTQSFDGGGYGCGLQFRRTLTEYAYKRRGRKAKVAAMLMMVLLAAVLVFMRIESVVYFKFNKLMYLYSMLTAAYLLTRYLFGALYKPVPVHPDYRPSVSIVIPCFNEEEWITRTFLSCLNQNYPPERLEVIVVDDCSNDRSVEKIEDLLRSMRATKGYERALERCSVVRQQFNLGKREALARGAKLAKHELVVFVDSDSFLDPNAIVHLVQPFQDPEMCGVTGRTDVANTYTNLVTKMQSVRYYVSFRIMKAAEAYFDVVTCLSGPLSCYRKDVVLAHCEDWLQQKFLGMRATFGDDRAMTNFVLRNHRTGYQDTAICSTIVPNTHRVFLKQQMRWKRSWLRESCVTAKFVWRKEPLMALSFYCGFFIPILAPVIVLYNLVYAPLVNGFFPRTFLVGLMVTAMLMSAAQLLLRRSSTWLYGIGFYLYYLLVLMWQMPYAWVTFWKSTWGTRMTPEDLAALGIEQAPQAPQADETLKAG